MNTAIRVNMSATKLDRIINRANEALRTGINVDLMIRTLRAYLDSKFIMTLETETIMIGLLACLLAI